MVVVPPAGSAVADNALNSFAPILGAKCFKISKKAGRANYYFANSNDDKSSLTYCEMGKEPEENN